MVPTGRHKRKPGTTWIELQTALLLDDTIIDLLIKDMNHKGWPNENQEKADPKHIFKALRTAIRSTFVQKQSAALQDMCTKCPRLKGWGLRNGLACLRGAPSWPTALKEDVKRTIIMAQAKDESDYQKAQRNVRMNSRPLALQGFEKWLTNRAGPHTDERLRTQMQACLDKMQPIQNRNKPTTDQWCNGTGNAWKTEG